MPEAASSSSTRSPVRVVVVGCQYAGLQFLQTFLQELTGGSGKSAQFPEHLHITVINAKEYLFHNMASPRTLADYQQWNSRVFVPLDQMFGELGKVPELQERLRFIVGTVTQVGPTEVQYSRADGGQVGTEAFDYLILATGTNYHAPCKLLSPKLTEGQAELKRLADGAKNAESILVVGGGVTGVEVAAELASQYPGKKITLVHAHEKLLSGLVGVSPKLQDQLKKMLVKKGVELVLGEKLVVEDLASLDGNSRKTLKTDKGRELTSDFQVICTGYKFNTGYLTTLEGGKTLDDAKAVKVNEYLQVEGHINIFAIGDIISTPGWKLGYLAAEQGKTVAKSLASAFKALEKAGKPWNSLAEVPKALQPWKGAPMKVVSVVSGKDGGRTQMGNFIAGNFITRTLKSKSIFYANFWKLANKSTPP